MKGASLKTSLAVSINSYNKGRNISTYRMISVSSGQGIIRPVSTAKSTVAPFRAFMDTVPHFPQYL
jgi:hypothetical protein